MLSVEIERLLVHGLGLRFSLEPRRQLPKDVTVTLPSTGNLSREP